MTGVDYERELLAHRAAARTARESARVPYRNRSVRLRVDQWGTLDELARRNGSTVAHLIRLAVDEFVGRAR